MYAIALLAIGAIHLVTQHFPAGLLPVPATLPGKIVLANINGVAMVLAAIWILLKPHDYRGRWPPPSSGYCCWYWYTCPSYYPNWTMEANGLPPWK
ncbi:hypothetical protein [Paraflavitalea speifideaquila]|uniref:hypothetical protein n=1 Tax=Paraflavitalea speifideaquila TaxID=3076558 RepID=UPI0028E5F174|nr:hypothetical protein [Paraflavitalea speifideiaquila]